MHIFAKSEPSSEMEMALRLVILSIFAFYTIDGKILFFDILAICLLCKACIFKRHRANVPIPVRWIPYTECWKTVENLPVSLENYLLQGGIYQIWTYVFPCINRLSKLDPKDVESMTDLKNQANSKS